MVFALAFGLLLVGGALVAVAASLPGDGVTRAGPAFLALLFLLVGGIALIVALLRQLGTHKRRRSPLRWLD